MEHIKEKEILEFVTENPTFKNWVYAALLIAFLYVIGLLLK
jgi:hypothetical protein